MVIRLTGVTAAGGLSVACLAYGLGVTPWQMSGLRAERAELKASMARLRASGADGGALSASTRGGICTLAPSSIHDMANLKATVE
jgi:hypothetical protein